MAGKTLEENTKIQLLFDRVTKKYKRGSRTHKIKIEKIIQLSKFKRDDQIIDIGCGDGRHTIMLAKRGINVTGIDCSKEMVNKSRKNAKNNNLNKNIKFIVGSATQIPYPSDYFDGLYCVSTLQYIQSPQKAIREFKRVVKPGAYVTITLPNPLFLGNLVKILLNYKYISLKYYNPFLKRKIMELFKKEGFTEIIGKRYIFFPSIPNIFENIYTKIEELLYKIKPLRVFAVNIIIIAKK